MCCMMMHAVDHTMHSDTGTQGASSQDETLLQILKRRFAMGKITQEQYQAMQSILGLGRAASVDEHTRH